MNKLCLTLFLLGSAGLCNAELIRNGSFEAVGPDKLPQHWLFTAKGSERAQPNITLTTVSDAGRRQAKPWSASPTPPPESTTCTAR